MPGTIEEVKLGWRLIGLYVPGRPRRPYCGFVLRNVDSVRVGCEHGVLLADPTGGLLGEGERMKRVRYVSLRLVDNKDPASLSACLCKAAEFALLPSPIRRLLMISRPLR